MKNFILKNGPLLIVLLWFIILGIVATLITGCNTSANRIEPGDLVIKCVVDSSWTKQGPGTIPVEPNHYVRTSCGEIHKVNNPNVYHIGDTIIYVYKK
jgi:hypothetical protein